MEYSANINGISVSAYYSDETVREVFIPLLEHLEKLHAEKQRRILVMLAAPPGQGKAHWLASWKTWQRMSAREKRFSLSEWTDFTGDRNIC